MGGIRTCMWCRARPTRTSRRGAAEASTSRSLPPLSTSIQSFFPSAGPHFDFIQLFMNPFRGSTVIHAWWSYAPHPTCPVTPFRDPSTPFSPPPHPSVQAGVSFHMPQNEHMELHKKRYGQRLDFAERKRKVRDTNEDTNPAYVILFRFHRSSFIVDRSRLSSYPCVPLVARGP